MKKQNLKSLALNKKSISNFQINGGKPQGSYNCVPVGTTDCEIHSKNNLCMSTIITTACPTAFCL